MSKYIGLVLADIHVGASNLEKLENQFNEMILHNIEKMDHLDFLIIAGDFFDHKFYLNDKESIVAYRMLKNLILVCKEKSTVVRIVYGTESHENNQYDILSLLKIYDKVEVVKYAKEEELLPDLHILYLPEEHLLDKYEYYKKYFSNTKKYDYIFGHGIIREVMKDQVVHIENNTGTELKRKKVPIFSSVELLQCCKGQVYFGHYHLNQELNDRIFSIGSFTRWQFGEEGRKGYYQISCNTEKNKYKNEYIENTMAETFTTIAYGYDNQIFESDEQMTNALNRVDKLIDDNVFDHVRFVFNIPNTAENPEYTINYLKEKYKFNKQVKLEIAHGYVEEKRKLQKEKVEADNKKYDFIFDKSLPLEDKISKYIEITHDRSIPSDRISKYLYLPLNEIILGEGE